MITLESEDLEIVALSIITATDSVCLTNFIWSISSILIDCHQTKNLILSHIFVPHSLQD